MSQYILPTLQKRLKVIDKQQVLITVNQSPHKFYKLNLDVVKKIDDNQTDPYRGPIYILRLMAIIFVLFIIETVLSVLWNTANVAISLVSIILNHYFAGIISIQYPSGSSIKYIPIPSLTKTMQSSSS